ncbi:hypothetical protein HSBAA_03830 [Vreelandella sulfidaeris]|uniref:Glycosyltransferase subfamily 4-like N-terminal domain-containing protein n=1 Tax=Vreelandella sulfidaeris TaxID=115553 RepID=A0A455U0L2_9GAMM|nr:hypothetical protein HSBAA_03830 [Halomonas sulfidaeris]
MQVQRLALPGYSDVQVGLVKPATLRRFWQQHRPAVIYLATQGPLGWAARQAARQLNIPLVAGWHTNFDHYCEDYGVTWLASTARRYLRYFHNGCALTLVPTICKLNRLSNKAFGASMSCHVGWMANASLLPIAILSCVSDGG